jgi:hypothetical protein
MDKNKYFYEIKLILHVNFQLNLHLFETRSPISGLKWPISSSIEVEEDELECDE